MSVKATPVRSPAAVPLGFVIVKVSVEVEPTGICDGLNDLVIDGGATTVTVAVLLVVPVPPSVELMAPVVLLCNPEIVPVTGTVKVQLLP